MADAALNATVGNLEGLEVFTRFIISGRLGFILKKLVEDFFMEAGVIHSV